MADPDYISRKVLLKGLRKIRNEWAEGSNERQLLTDLLRAFAPPTSKVDKHSWPFY